MDQRINVELYAEDDEVEIKIVRRLKSGRRRIISMSEPEAWHVSRQLQRSLGAVGFLSEDYGDAFEDEVEIEGVE